MEQNHIPTSPEAAAQPASIPAHPAASAHPNGAADPTPRRIRHDGWTPERQVIFLEALAASGVVADACRQAGLSCQSAYAFRNRRAGRAFAIAWDAVLVHRARGRLGDELMSRAMNGITETVRDKDGEVCGERRRYDNRLSMAVLTRLDRLAEGMRDEDDLLRAMSEDLDDFLDCVEAGGDADAFVEARRPAPEPEPEDVEYEPPLRIEDEWDRMAQMLGCLDYKRMHASDIDISDLPGPDMEGCDVDQYLRAHYSGYLIWVDVCTNRGACPVPAEELSPAAFREALRPYRIIESEDADDTASEIPAPPVRPAGEHGGPAASRRHQDHQLRDAPHPIAPVTDPPDMGAR